MATQFSDLVNDALDEIASYKTFVSKPDYKVGISTETKLLMEDRDRARLEVRATHGEKWITIKKCKTLRNRATNQIRNDVKRACLKR